MDENTIEKIINSKVVEKAYDNGLSSPLVEVSKIGVDVVKSARLILAPLQLAATFQDRFEIFLSNLNKRVPEDKAVQVPAELSSVCLDKMRYLNNENPLWQMFEELLIKASHGETQELVHPSFGLIISQLAPDEAVILYELSLVESFEVEDTLDLNREKNRFENRKVLRTTIPVEKLINPESMGIYYSHLESLSLVTWPLLDEKPIWDRDENDPNKVQLGTKRKSKLLLTEFGQLFAKASIPEQGFKYS